MQITTHAAASIQQRGVPPQIVKSIIAHGSTRRMPGNAIARFVSRKDYKVLQKMLPKNDCVSLEKYRNVYIVMKDSQILTVGRRTRRYKNVN